MGDVCGLSINDKQLRSNRGPRPMRLSIVGHLLAHAGREHKAAAIGQLGVQFACKAEQHLAFYAPMIGQVTGFCA